MEESRLKESDDGLKWTIHQILSWDLSNKTHMNLDRNDTERDKKKKLQDSTILLTQLRSRPNIDRGTLTALAHVLISHVHNSQQDKFLLYNSRRILACLFTTFENKDLKKIYQADLLVQLIGDTNTEVKIIILEITSDILNMCDRSHLSDWLDMLLIHWTKICNNIFEEDPSFHHSRTVKYDTERTDGGNGNLTSEARDMLDLHVSHGIDTRGENMCKVWCKLTLLWTEIVRKCFLQYGSLRGQLISFVKNVSLVIPCLNMLNKTSTIFEIMVFKSTVKLFNAVFDYGQTFAVQHIIDDTIINAAESVLDWYMYKRTYFSNLSLSNEKGFGGEMSVSRAIMWTDLLVDQSIPENSSRSKKRKLICFDTGRSDASPTVSHLRDISLLILKVAAVAIRFGKEDDRLSSSSMVLNHLDLDMGRFYTTEFNWIHQDMGRFYTTGFNWIHQVYLDQDDNWVEALLSMLDIYLHLQKRMIKNDPSMKFCSTLSPHRQFLWLLHTTNFDHSIFVDLLISPETCFLLYFTKYLKLVQKEWDSFTETLQSMGKQLDGKWTLLQHGGDPECGKSSVVEGREMTCLPEERSEMTCLPEERSEMTGLPEERCEMTCLPEERSEVTCLPEERSEVTGLPEERSEMTGLPAERSEMTGLPAERSEMTCLPEERSEMTGLPEERPEMTGLPAERSEMTCLPEERPEMTGLPEERSEMTGLPAERSEMTGLPAERSEMTCLPEERSEMTCLPEERPEMTGLPAERSEMTCLPEERPEMTGLPEEESDMLGNHPGISHVSISMISSDDGQDGSSFIKSEQTRSWTVSSIDKTETDTNVVHGKISVHDYHKHGKAICKNSVSSMCNQVPTSRLHDKTGLALLSTYDDDDDDDEAIDTSCLLEGTDDTADSLLDKTMAVLIRTRLKVEEFMSSSEVVYNAMPLISLIEACEILYEQGM